MEDFFSERIKGNLKVHFKEFFTAGIKYSQVHIYFDTETSLVIF